MQWPGVRTAGALLASAVAIAGCGATTRSATTTAALPQPTAPTALPQKTTPSKPATPSQAMHERRARRGYLAAVQPVNAARRTAGAKQRTWTGSTTPAQAAADLTPYQKALKTLRPSCWLWLAPTLLRRPTSKRSSTRAHHSKTIW